MVDRKPGHLHQAKPEILCSRTPVANHSNRLTLYAMIQPMSVHYRYHRLPKYITNENCIELRVKQPTQNHQAYGQKS